MVSGEVHQMWKEVLMCGSRDSADRTGVLRLPDAVSVLLDATGRKMISPSSAPTASPVSPRRVFRARATETQSSRSGPVHSSYRHVAGGHDC